VLAATLAASYGMYGPAFELAEARNRDTTSEEYLDSEKYQLRHWDTSQPHSMAPMIATLNRLRHEHRALQSDWSLAFHASENPNVIAYSKHEGDDRILVVVNLDPHHTQSGTVYVDALALGMEPGTHFRVRDVLRSETYAWKGGGNYVILDPDRGPAHVFVIE
jgi:starch synthase (maltosyl-transferring)